MYEQVMQIKQFLNNNIFRKAGNILVIGLLLLMIFNPNAKSWMLKQLIAVGLFKAEIKKEAAANAANLSFDIRDENGNTISTASLKGKVVFINFWATWCPPCRAEMPSLNALYNKLKNDDNFVFLFINEDEDAGKAKRFLQSNHFSFSIKTAAGNIPDDIYSGTLPTTVVINKEGKLMMKHEGIANYNTEEFIKELKKLL